jgi:phage head maturation protease
VPILEQPIKASEEHEDESQSTEEDEALAKLFKVKMMEIPWVKAAARAAKRQDKAKKQREKKKKKKKKK